MQGLMMDYPLTLTQFFERSRRLFAQKTLASRGPGGARGAPGRARRHLGVEYPPAPGGVLGRPLMGAVLHTVNFRAMSVQRGRMPARQYPTAAGGCEHGPVELQRNYGRTACGGKTKHGMAAVIPGKMLRPTLGTWVKQRDNDVCLRVYGGCLPAFALIARSA